MASSREPSTDRSAATGHRRLAGQVMRRIYCEFRGLYVSPVWDGHRYICGGCGAEVAR